MLMISLRPLLASVLLVIPSCAERAPSPEEIVVAERAFAADGYARGVKASFLDHSSDDAIIFAPGPVNAHETLKASPDENLAEPRKHLVWWPLYAGISKSGDLGFTTGPYAIDEDRRGHYFTIWKKEASGAWKWVLDAGVGADASAEAAQGSPVAFMPTSRAGSASPDEAFRDVGVIEGEIAARAEENLLSAYEAFLDDDSRLHSDGSPPAKSREGRGAVFAVRPPALKFAQLGGGASAAGDFVWTYGEGRWSEEGGEKLGHYVRVWRKRRAGWRIVFDEFLPPPEAPAE